MAARRSANGWYRKGVTVSWSGRQVLAIPDLQFRKLTMKALSRQVSPHGIGQNAHSSERFYRRDFIDFASASD